MFKIRFKIRRKLNTGNNWILRFNNSPDVPCVCCHHEYFVP